MFQALYGGATALDALSKKHEQIASNLAHLNTPGHRRKMFSSAERVGSDTSGVAGQLVAQPGTVLDRQSTDFSNAAVVATGRQLDLALSGDGFFVFQGPESELYSRNGVLTRRADGTLVNLDNMPVLGDRGNMQIDPNVPESHITVDVDGTVSVLATPIGKLKLVAFEDNQKLSSEGQVYFQAAADAGQKTAEALVRQGHRENSNAHPVTELISLIIGSRHYEAAQRAIQTISQTLQENLRS